MKILGIDPGSLITGYGVVESTGAGKLLHVSNGSVAVSGSLPLSERLLAISTALTSLIEEHTPDAVAVESVFFAKNARSAIMLGHARGVVLLSAASAALEVFEYAPRSVKQAVTGYGNATKDQVQKMVQMLLSIPAAKNADAADALAIAICHINSHRLGSRTRDKLAGLARNSPGGSTRW